MKALVQSILVFDGLIFLKVFSLGTQGHERNKLTLTRFFYSISRSADGQYYLLIPLIAWLLKDADASAFLFAALKAFALELPIYKLIKNTTKRMRPFAALAGVKNRIRPPDRYSFPSGHTAGAFVIAVLGTNFFPLFGVVAFPWAMLVGMSRIYLGVHYPLDVLIGCFVGVSCACVILFLSAA